MVDYSDKRSLAEVYNIQPDDYAGISVLSLPFSIRVQKRFRQKKIMTVKDLLQVDISFLMGIRGFGANCLYQVLGYCEALSQSTESVAKTHGLTVANAQLLSKYKDAIAVGNFSFADGLELSHDQEVMLVAYKDAYEKLGKDLVFDCVYAPEKIRPLVEALAEFDRWYSRLKKLEGYYYQIPAFRRNNGAKYYIEAFSYDDDVRSSLFKCFFSADDELGAIVNSISVENDGQSIIVERFLKWCSFDLSEEISQMFDEVYSTPRVKTIIEGRAKGLTLKELGDYYCVSRERIRQIEAKAKRKFDHKIGKVKVMSKLYADKDGQSIITLEDISEVGGDNAAALIYLLQDNTGGGYTYDHQLDVFIFGDNDISLRIQDYVDSLPDVLTKNEYVEAIELAREEYNFDIKYVERAINEVYKTTGNVLHRSRLSLAKIYDATLRKYYSDGIHIYDDEEINDLRHHIHSDYGNINLPDANRSIAARISAVCLLAGRGRYIPKKNKWISPELAQKILSYILDNDSPILLIGNIFSIFEAELAQEGVDNRFYLQGILRELFGDRFYFRKDYISKDKGLTSIYSSIVLFIKAARCPVKKYELKKYFRGITDIVISLAVSDSNILNYFGEYLHGNNLVIREMEKKYLCEYLAFLLDDGEAHHITEIYADINRNIPEIFGRNSVTGSYSAFSMLEYLFREKYQFSRPYIALNGVEVGRPNERLHELLYSMDEFCVSDITEFAKENHMHIPSLIDLINSFNDKYLMLDSRTLASINDIGIDSSIANEVEICICSEISDTTPIREMKCIPKLPQINAPWNEWLVYSVLKKWSKRLDVALSSSQLRQSIPLVSFVGEMNVSKFKDVSNEPSRIQIDNMDDIDDLIADIISDELLEEPE